MTAARRLTGRRSSLWYATLTPSFHRTWRTLNDEVGLWLPGNRPPVTPHRALAFEVVCDERLSRRKYDALRSHASQVAGLVARVGEDRFRRWRAVESFVEAPPEEGQAPDPGRVRDAGR